MPHSEQGERLKVEFHISTRRGIGPGAVCFIRSAFCYLYDEGTGLRQGHLMFIYLFMLRSPNHYRHAAYSYNRDFAARLPSYGSEYYRRFYSDAFSSLYQYALVLARSLALNGISL